MGLASRRTLRAALHYSRLNVNGVPAFNEPELHASIASAVNAAHALGALLHLTEAVKQTNACSPAHGPAPTECEGGAGRSCSAEEFFLLY